MNVILFRNPIITQESYKLFSVSRGYRQKNSMATNFMNRFVLLSETDKITSNVLLLWVEELNLKI